MRLAITAAAVMFAYPATAQLECQPAGGLHEILAGKYGESIIRASECTADGVQGQCLTWRNGDTGSWTIAFYPNAAFACILAVGADSERDG